MNKLSTDISPYIQTLEGMHYIPWVTALSLAEWPRQDVATFGPVTGAVRPLFGGGVVAVDQAVTPTGPIQRTWLPITDAKSKAVPLESISCRDTGDTINRCRARAVATINGVGLCLYAKMTSAAEFVRKLGVTPQTEDLTQVPPIADRKLDKHGRPVGFPFLGWHSALAAARITDPTFVWSVVEFETFDPVTGAMETLPAMKVPGRGWMVAVDVTWKGRTHREFLPIMGPGEVQTRNGPKVIDHQPLEHPDANDWHRATMRCLAKAIALTTGYGISLYADEIAVAPTNRDDLLAQIHKLLKETRADVPKLLAFYGLASLDDADEPMARRIITGLERKLAQMAKAAVSTSTATDSPPAEPGVDSARAQRVETIRAKAKQADVDEARLVAFNGGVPLEDAEDATLDRIEASLDTILKSRKPAARRAANG